MKLKKLFVPTVVTGILISSSQFVLAEANTVETSSNANTEEATITKDNVGDIEVTKYEYNKPILTDYESVDLVRKAYIPYDGRDYSPYQTKKYTQIDWKAELKNGGKTSDTVTKLISRSQFCNGKIGAEASVKLNMPLIEDKIKFNAEVSFGTTTVDSVSYTWTIPPKHTTYISFGSKAVKTMGTVSVYKRGSLSKSEAIDVKYSTRVYYAKS